MVRKTDNATVILDTLHDWLDRLAKWSGGNNTISIDRLTDHLVEVTFEDGSIVVIRTTNRKPGEASL